MVVLFVTFVYFIVISNEFNWILYKNGFYDISNIYVLFKIPIMFID